MMRARLLLTVLLLGVTSVQVASRAEDANPFRQRDEERARPRRQQPAIDSVQPPLAPVEGPSGRPAYGDAGTGWAGQQPVYRPAAPISSSPIEREALPPLDDRSAPVESSLPAPSPGSPRSNLPSDVWQGMASADSERLIAALDLPPRSPALAKLWRRVWTASETGSGSPRLRAVRLEALLRAGLLDDAMTGTEQAPQDADALLAALSARLKIGIGDRQNGCTEARAIARATSLPNNLRSEMLLLVGYCAAASGDVPAAELALDLIRSEDIANSFGFAVLDAVSSKQEPKVSLPKRLTLLDHRFMELAGIRLSRDILERSEIAALAMLAMSKSSGPGVRVAAAEMAARENALDPARLAEVYRAASGDVDASGDAPLRRASLFRAIEAERTPSRKTRLIRQLLDEARRAGIDTPVAATLATSTETVSPIPEVGWFAETAIEVGLTAGRYDIARRWVDAADRFDRGGSLRHWMLLIDLADPDWQGRRGDSLGHAEQFALRGRLNADLLHRLVTVLDALDYQIPIPLWEAASRTPQPTAGHLPETGVLTRLQDASKRKDLGQVVLLAMTTVGHNTADATHVIALGDTIRALRRAGLEAEARRFALEAVLSGWPRQAAG